MRALQKKLKYIQCRWVHLWLDKDLAVVIPAHSVNHLIKFVHIQHFVFIQSGKRIHFFLSAKPNARWRRRECNTVGVNVTRQNCFSIHCYRSKQQYKQSFSSQCSRDVELRISVSLHGDHIKQLKNMLLSRYSKWLLHLSGSFWKLCHHRFPLIRFCPQKCIYVYKKLTQMFFCCFCFF